MYLELTFWPKNDGEKGSRIKNEIPLSAKPFWLKECLLHKKEGFCTKLTIQ